MSLLSWFLDEKKDEPNQSSRSPKFLPRICVDPKSTLYVQVEPKDPNNCSNIIITAFASQQIRSIVPIRVEWSRFKLRGEAVHTVEKIHCLVGNTYMCEPGDVGAFIKAVVRSVDDGVRAEAEVTVGPIGIDVMMKRLIEGALYSGSLFSQVTVCEKDRKNNVSLRLNTRTMQFVDENSDQKLVKDYSMSEPKIELNPKDSTRVYLRFEQDQVNAVREWLNTIYNVRNASIDESSMSIKVPYGGHSASSSKLKLFQKTDSHCINKIELMFISRNSRDLFLFTQRAFICREDMKNSIYLQRIETLQTISTEDDYYHFLGYISLKTEIIRLADFAKELEDDRNQKVKDLANMEESIGDMTLTYLKIIEDKGKGQHVDFEASYSQISMTREEMMNRKHVREMKSENESLKQRLREMNEEIELLKFFKKEENESVIFNQTSNPFAKKGNNNNELSVSHVNALSPEENKANRKNMYDMSMNYTKILEENTELKRNAMGQKKVSSNHHDKSKNMMELLGDLQEKQENEVSHMQYEKRIDSLSSENQELKNRIKQLMSAQCRSRGMNVTSNNKSLSINERSIIDQSMINRSGTTSVADSSMNYSMTSEAAMMKLEDNLRSLSVLNAKLQEDTTRLRRERDYYRTEAGKLNKQIKEIEALSGKNKQERSMNFTQNDQSGMNRYKEQNQILQNEKKGLMRRLQSLSKQNTNGIREEFLQKQKKLKQYEQLIDKLKLQNISMNKDLDQDNIKNQQLQFFTNQNINLKKINSQLLEQIKSLKIQLEIRGDNLYNSRAIEMQNELKIYKSDLHGEAAMGKDNRKLLDQINQLSKSNAKLKQENKDKQSKLDHQTVTIEKLMKESSKPEHSTVHKKYNSSSSSTKEKAYSEKCSQATVEEIEKYKREVKKLQEEIICMRKSSDAINRSRDLTLEMDEYHQQKMEVMKKQLEALYVQNENLSKMCERYGKDAREANKELNKWRQKAMELTRQKNEESSLLSGL